jgi:trans-2,3-dihydro-3-hydroxyanthranilate isomerase
MGRRIHIVDVFAERRLEGNQLAVVIDSDDLASAEMQAIAREMNYSETTFLLEREPRDGGYDVRIFTPVEELPFAGHPTLGTAYVIRETVAGGRPSEVALNLKIGRVPVRFEPGADGRPIAWMKAPEPVFGSTGSAELAAAAASVRIEDVDSRLPIQEVSVGISFVFVPLRSLDALRRCRFDLSLREDLKRAGLKGFAVFAFTRETHETGNDFAARMFFDANGLREDPATGSANACFAAYLLKHAYAEEGRLDLRVEQGYEIDRSSLLFLRASGADGVSIGGHVVPVLRGELV